MFFIKLLLPLLYISFGNTITCQVPSWAKDQGIYNDVLDSVTVYLHKRGVTRFNIEKEKGVIIIKQNIESYYVGTEIGIKNMYESFVENSINPSSYLLQVEKSLKNEKVVKTDLKRFKTAKKYLKLRLYPEGYIQDTNYVVRKGSILGFIEAVVVDTDFGIKILQKTEIANWEISVDAIFRTGLNQTKSMFDQKLFQELQFGEQGNLHWYTDENNFFVNTLLLNKTMWSDYDKGKGVIICIPTRHHFVVIPVVSEKFDDNLLSIFGMNYEVFNNETGKTSLDMLLYKDNQFHLIHPLINNENKSVNFVVSEASLKIINK